MEPLIATCVTGFMLYMFNRLTNIERDIVCSQDDTANMQRGIIVETENQNVQVIMGPCIPHPSCSSIINHQVICEQISACNKNDEVNYCNQQKEEVEPHQIKSDRCCSMVCNPGKITGNPFLNFVREFRKERCGRRQADIIKEAARHWNKLPQTEKADWVEAARIFRKAQIEY